MIDESTFILADKGYQRRYNQIVSKSRALIERINRSLKVFRILSGRLRKQSANLKIYSAWFAAFLILAILCKFNFRKCPK